MSDTGTKQKRNEKSAGGFFARICDPDSGTKLLTPVLVLYAVSFLIHSVLNILMKETQTVIIDEGLYTNIARSLAWKGELAFRAQPVNYPYLLYPMLLVPLYRIQRLLGWDAFRMIQVFNTLLITSSVIPAALFAFDFTKNRKKTYLAALITALMPDMLMGAYTMTECLVWPLALWMVFFAYRFFLSRKLTYGLLTALFTGLMYAAKPGAIAVGAALLVFFCVTSLRHDRGTLKISVPPLVLLLLVVGLVHGIFLMYYRNSTSLIGLYTKQTSAWHFKTLFVAIEAFFLQTFVFTFACGGISGIIPAVFLKEYDEQKRPFVMAVLIGVLLAVLGTAVFVVPFTWDDSLGQLPLHLRYCAMFIPVMFILSLGLEFHAKAKNNRFIAALTAFIVLSLFPGARAGFVVDRTTEFDSMALSSFTTTINHNGVLLGWLVTAAVVIFSLYVLKKYSESGFTAGLEQACMLFFGAFVLVNAVSAHVNTYIYIDRSVSADAREINGMIGDTECLGITQQRYDDYYSYWLESRLNEPMQQVTIDQMFLQMKETDGYYSPFIPVEQAPNVHNHETPDTDRFVLGKNIAAHLELNESVSEQKTQNGHFSFLQIDPSKRWVDTIMFGLDGNYLHEGVNGYVMILNENRDLGGKMMITLRAKGDGILDVGGARLELTEKERSYEITLPYDRYIDLKEEGGTAEILSYFTTVR